MGVKFIGITESGTGAAMPRVSTLQITEDGLCVLGNLPHGYTFAPTTARDRDKLCNWLQSQNYMEVRSDGLKAALIDITRSTKL